MIRIVILVLFSALLGCSASGPTFTKPSSVTESSGIVLLYRPTKSEGYLITPPVYVDGEKKFKLLNNGYAELKLTAGEHLIETRKDGIPIGPVDAVGEISIDVEAGKTYYVRWIPQMGNMEFGYAVNVVAYGRFSGGFYPVSEEEGLKEIARCKKIYP